jgi:hypothetical protein
MMNRVRSAFRVPSQRLGMVVCEGALALYFGALWLTTLATGRPWSDVWRRLGVRSYDRPFFDLSIVADAAAKSGQGVSPYALSNGLPPYNYPRLWVGWGALGLAPDTVFVSGLVVALGFWALSLAVVRPRTVAEGMTVAALWCSPAFMLGVERANTDLVVFVVLAVALLAQRRSQAAAAVAIFLAACAKLFPIAAIGALLVSRQSRRWVGVAAVLAGFGVYLWIFRGDIALISSRTPRDTNLSYGGAIPGQLAGAPYRLAWAGGAAAAAILAAAAWVAARRLPPLPDAPRSAFLAGAGIYGGTFLLGNNYEYRLVFLQCCLPALWFWAGGADGRGRRFAGVCLALCIGTCWWSLIARYAPHEAEPLRHVFTFALFATLAAAGVRSLTAETAS